MRYLLTAAVLLLFSSPAIADAVVVLTGSCGSRYIVETPLGYDLLEWYGGWAPSEGEVILGDLHSFGMKELYLPQSRSSTRAWVDDYMLSRARAEEELQSTCGITVDKLRKRGARQSRQDQP
jgi:hypothetical protein